ncbi:MAG: NUDIX domain-containing protein [Chloroflexi bacterium]|nr:NUDIX domain-containing protein [Chloroflexota bacterium]
MRFEEQGTTDNARYTVVPRTLVFVQNGDRLLLLRGAPDKRLWPNLLNGLGGHLEPGEDPLSGALREIQEEAGLVPDVLSLRALVHVSGRDGNPGVLLFVFLGHVPGPEAHPGAEGSLEWHALSALPWDEMVADLPDLLPRILAAERGVLYGLHEVLPGGDMAFRWRSAECAVEAAGDGTASCEAASAGHCEAAQNAQGVAH